MSFDRETWRKAHPTLAREGSATWQERAAELNAAVDQFLDHAIKSLAPPPPPEMDNYERAIQAVKLCKEFKASLTAIVHPEPSKAFDVAWRKLEVLGTCDGFGGAEYQRVRREYAAVGDWGDVEGFITLRANAMPAQVVP